MLLLVFLGIRPEDGLILILGWCPRWPCPLLRLSYLMLLEQTLGTHAGYALRTKPEKHHTSFWSSTFFKQRNGLSLLFITGYDVKTDGNN